MLTRMILAVDKHSEKRSFLPVISSFPILHFFIWIVPSLYMMIALCATMPRRWLTLATIFAIGTGLGALLVTLFIQYVGLVFFEGTLEQMATSARGEEIMAQIQVYGLLMLLLVSMMPISPRFPVMIFALTGASPLAIGLLVGVGRLVPSFGLGYMAAHSLSSLRRFRYFNRALTDLEIARAGKDLQGAVGK